MPGADAFIKHPDIEVSAAEAFPKFDRPEARGSDIPHNSEGGGVRAETFLEFLKWLSEQIKKRSELEANVSPQTATRVAHVPRVAAAAGRGWQASN